VILSWNSTADTVTSDVVSAWGADGITPTWATNWTAENTPQNLAPSNTWTRYSITATLDTASTNNVAVFIWCDDMTTTLGDFLYITDVQLEVGSLATPFERKTMQAVLADCYRYYWRNDVSADTNARIGVGMVVGTTCQAYMVHPVPMRVSTTGIGTSTAASSFAFYNGASNAQGSSVPTFDAGSRFGTNVSMSLSTSLSTNGGHLTRFSTPCWIEMSVEL
jgi:hypothetical protein